jgi:epoxyqueuosine reductase QueG
MIENSTTEADTRKIKEQAAAWGADLCGVADAERFSDAPRGHRPQDLWSGCRSVVVIASRFPIDRLDVADECYTTARDEMVEKMNWMAARLAEWMNEQGWPAKEMLSTRDGGLEADGRYRALLSMKHAAMMAGLGKIGKNTLLINNRYGNMIWLNAVLTQVPLAADPIADYDACLPDCNLCIRSCKAKALGNPAMSQHDCYLKAFRPVQGREDGKTEIILCNTCRVVCPQAFGCA